MKSQQHINAATISATKAALEASDTVPEAATLLLAVAHNMLTSLYGLEKANQWLLTQALAAPTPEIKGEASPYGEPRH